MLNMDEDKTALKALVTDTYDSLDCVGSLQEITQEHLNLWKVRMVSPHFCL